MPLILNDASISIDGQPLECVTNHLELSPDTSAVTVTVLCGETDYPGITKWSLVLTLEQSFDAGATEDVLSAAVAGGVPVDFEIIPYKSQPVSATNPSWSGQVVPAPYAPINGDAGAESTIDLEWAVVGEPTKSIVPGTTTRTTSTTSKA
jgi:hypothetical protein